MVESEAGSRVAEGEISRDGIGETPMLRRKADVFRSMAVSAMSFARPRAPAAIADREIGDIGKCENEQQRGQDDECGASSVANEFAVPAPIQHVAQG